MTRKYLRIADAIAETGITRRELMDIAHTPGQTLVRRMTPGAKNSPFIVDMSKLDAYMDARARESFVQPRGRL